MPVCFTWPATLTCIAFSGVAIALSLCANIGLWHHIRTDKARRRRAISAQLCSDAALERRVRDDFAACLRQELGL